MPMGFRGEAERRCFWVLNLGRLTRHAGPMPRAMRVEYPGAIYHVMDRGDRREDIFINDVDRQDLLEERQL
jgi:hypothetical protein